MATRTVTLIRGDGIGPEVAEAVLAAVQEALQVFEDKPTWRKLMLNGMSKDFSWGSSAKEYVKVYERVALKAAATREKPPGAAWA